MLLSKNGLTSPEKREFVEEILSLCKLNQVTAFAIGLRYPQTPEAATFSEPNTFLVIRNLVDRVEKMMKESYPAELAVMVFDSQADRKDTERALEFGNYLYGNPRGRSISQVADTPLFSSSKVTRGLQIADLFAYSISQQNLGRTDVKPYCDRIREMEWKSLDRDDGGPWRGFHFRDVHTSAERIGDSSSEAFS